MGPPDGLVEPSAPKPPNPLGYAAARSSMGETRRSSPYDEGNWSCSYCSNYNPTNMVACIRCQMPRMQPGMQLGMLDPNMMATMMASMMASYNATRRAKQWLKIDVLVYGIVGVSVG